MIQPTTNDASAEPSWPQPRSSTAILISGGLDSAILLGESLRRYAAVHPLYVRSGLAWEPVELEHLRRFLTAVGCPSLQSLQVLDLPVTDLYGSHWSITGQGVPDASTPDDAVFLPARNVLLLTKAMLWCHLHGVPSVMLATLRGNPFPDATPQFFRAFQDAMNQGLGSAVQVARPYEALSKSLVMRRGLGLPLEASFSCIRPVAGRHCGVCNKCAERHKALVEAKIEDRTEYALRA
jgi:7-cyano-7-deazaguanine synthase